MFRAYLLKDAENTEFYERASQICKIKVSFNENFAGGETATYQNGVILDRLAVHHCT